MFFDIHLQQGRQLVHLLSGCPWVHYASQVGEPAVGAYERISRHRLPEDLHPEHVLQQLLRLPVEVRVHQGDVVVAGDDVAQRGQARRVRPQAGHPHRVRQGVPGAAQLAVGGAGREEEAAPVPGGQAANDAAAAEGEGHHGEGVGPVVGDGQLSLQGGEEAGGGGAVGGSEAVGVVEEAEGSYVAAAFKVEAGEAGGSHGFATAAVGAGGG